MVFISQNFKGADGRIVRDDPATIHDDEPVGHRDHILQPMLTNEDRGTQFPVDAAQGLQEIRGSDGVQLAGRLVQDQKLRLQNHD